MGKIRNAGQEGWVGKEASQDGQQRHNEISFTINNSHSFSEQARFGIPRHGVLVGGGLTGWVLGLGWVSANIRTP